MGAGCTKLVERIHRRFDPFARKRLIGSVFTSAQDTVSEFLQHRVCALTTLAAEEFLHGEGPATRQMPEGGRDRRLRRIGTPCGIVLELSRAIGIATARKEGRQTHFIAFADCSFDFFAGEAIQQGLMIGNV